MMRYALNRPDVEEPWLFDRCREVQADPNEHLDLWAREHYKSTIITFAKTIQDILASHGDDPVHDREYTFGLFSFNAGTSQKFVTQIKEELENNDYLKNLFPDVLYQNPKKDSPSWSTQNGLVVKRKGNPKEPTLSGHGLIDSMPTGSHFFGRLYDDVITERFARSPDMIAKATESWELSLNLGARGGFSRYIGTRYHYNDPYRVIMQRKAAIPRIYTATHNGKITGTPVLLTPEDFAKKRREMGPYVFGCHTGMTTVLMADWSYKPIKDVVVGDKVVGFEQSDGGRTTTVITEVLATKRRTAPTVRVRLESGYALTCTPDHKWWSGRWREGLTYRYIDEIDGPVRMAPEVRPIPEGCEVEAGWLGGMFDGEGSLSGGSIHIHQSEKTNPDVCRRLREVFTKLGFEWGETLTHSDCIDFFLTGGRQARFDFMSWCKPVKVQRIIDSLYGAKNGNHRNADKVTRSVDWGERTVYNIQTGTGNYIADGYASKNCQMMQDPKSDETQGFKREWLRFYDRGDGSGMNKYILVDPAGEKKKGSDYTAMAVIGLAADRNYYLLDAVYDRLNLKERTKALFALHHRWRPKGVGYEKYGKDSDIEHIEEKMEDDNYRFEITPLGGQVAKNDRIKKLVPVFSEGRFYLPTELHKTNYEGTTQDLIEKFLSEEYDPFPVPVHDDFFDNIARILDEEMATMWPQLTEDKDRDRYAKKAAPRRRVSSWRSV